MKRITTILILAFLVSCQKPESIIELTNPITYNLVQNLVKNNKPTGKMTIEVSWFGLHPLKDGYYGTVFYDIRTPEYADKFARIEYKLFLKPNKSHQFASIGVLTPGDESMTIYNVNLTTGEFLPKDSAK